MANRHGSEPVQLTDSGRFCGSPRWSPDGRWIVFLGQAGGGHSNIWTIESGGGKPRELTHGPGTPKDPSFSRDGKWVYFESDRSGRSETFRVPFSGGPAMQVTHSGGNAPQESIDGRTLYYLNAGVYVSRLYEVPAVGGQERSLDIPVVLNAFDVVSNGVYFIAPAGQYGRGREIRFYDFLTHRSRVIQALGDVETWRGFSVSTDQKTFLYSVRQDNGGNLMLVENFH